MKTDYEVIVAGAGPAGASALRHLPPGSEVLILDAGDPLTEAHRPKLCGGMLTKEAQALLPELPQRVRAEPFKTHLEYHDLDTGTRARFPVAYANCDRGWLETWLLEEALASSVASAEYLPWTRITDMTLVTSGEAGVSIGIEDGRRVTARCLLDCSGWRQLARRSLDVPDAPYLHSFQATCRLGEPYPFYIAVFKSEWTPFFGWFVPKHSREGEVGIAVDQNRRSSPESILSPLVEHLLGVGLKMRLGQIRGCRLTRPLRRRNLWLGTGPVLACGEAAGLVSPSSGDGISYALASGRAAAEVVGLPPERALPSYRRKLRRELSELSRNMVKARVLADSRSRRVAAAALTVIHGSSLERLSL